MKRFWNVLILMLCITILMAPYIAAAENGEPGTGVETTETTQQEEQEEEQEEEHEHSFRYWVVVYPTVEESGRLGGLCRSCLEPAAQVTLPKLSEEEYDSRVITEADCTTLGWTVYTWKETKYGEITVNDLSVTGGHDYQDPVVDKEPTHREPGQLRVTCSVCRDDIEVQIPVLNQISYTIETSKEPTCEENGYGVYIWNITLYGEYRFESEVPPTGHDLETEITEVTCTTDGIMERKCKNCDYATTSVTAYATGHSFGEWAVNDEGYQERTCSKCDEVETGGIVNPFVDVNESMFCYDAVLWAYYSNITTGTDATHFNPAGNCSRAQVVTFLWRAAGQPEPKSSENPFPDVAKGKFYYKAVLWAVENGITAGFKDGTFGPNKTCTRAQIVTFLWRYAQEPMPNSMENPFPDVDTNAYYGQAVLWAVERGITSGYKDGTFGPGKTCKRDQIVTFLYRYMSAE